MIEPHDRAESIFAAAIVLATAEDRAAYLDQACASDISLRQHVEALLRASERGGHMLDRPVPGGPEKTWAYMTIEQPGTFIAGRYKLLEKIGEGGMGTVWVAEQTVPVRRKVALKLIKAGMDSKSVLARFEAERQALAVMDHPNIAKVLDGGLTEAGRPFFVMEYVKGIPITEYCDAARLRVPERLQLFVQVCQAVQHAHQKGIIHRDLKPSNILVAPYDDKPVPKVIDFGLAKAMHQSLTEMTLHTAHEAVLGTPLYMSPEQVQLNNIDVDTRSDIYSLGVLLYELLTGSTPLEHKRFKEAAWEEIKRIIREEDPPRPSTRLSSANTLPTLAAGRQTEPARLTKLVRGELDWIVMKSLEKDRSRRYETATSFAIDVQHYLSGEPVLAVPPSARYRIQKLLRKHRTALTTAAALTLLLVAGVAVSTWQARRAIHAEAVARLALADAEAARSAEAEARKRAENNEQSALQAAASEKLARAAAQERETETKAVLDFVENRVFAAARPEGEFGGLGQSVTLLQAVEAALPFIERSFTKQRPIEARLRMSMGISFLYMGKAKIAVDQFQEASKIYTELCGPDNEQTLWAMNLFGNSLHDDGRFVEATRVHEGILARRKAKYGFDHAATLNSMNNLANCYGVLGRESEAVKLREETVALCKVKLGLDHRDTLTAMNNLASSYFALHRFAESLELREATLSLLEAKFPSDNLSVLNCKSNLAEIYFALGRHQEALKLREQILETQVRKLGPNHPITLDSKKNLGDSFHHLGQQDAALKTYMEAFEGRRLALGPDHPDTIKSMNTVANCYASLGRLAEAVNLNEEALVLCTGKLGMDHPDTLSLAFHVGMRKKDWAACRRVSEIWEKLNFTDPRNLYSAAGRRAMTAAVIQQDSTTSADEIFKLATVESERAMTLLKQAVGAGYKNVQQIKQDNFLDALRNRDDFKKLLADLEAKH